MKRAPYIEVVVSTLNDGIDCLQLNENFHYLIIHQVTTREKQERYDQIVHSIQHPNFRYIRSYSGGLSKSRNIGLKNSQGDYVWIMDDDVLLLEGAEDQISNFLIDNDSVDLFILNYTSDDRRERCYVNDAVIKKMNSISVASVASINMLIKKSSVSNIKFDEKFGLGTQYPSGEEYIFCCDLLQQDKTIVQTNLVVSYHPLETSGQDFYTTPLKLIAKKKMFIRGNGFLKGYLLFIAFLLKKWRVLTKNKAYLNIIKALVR